MKRSKKLLRALSFVLLQSFIVQQISFAEVITPRISKQELQSKPEVGLEFPASVASIEDAYKNGGDKLFYLIQDAHTNESGQYNLASALATILDKEKDLHFVFTEAGVGNNSLSFLRSKKTATERESIARAYIKKGYLHGAEYLDLTTDRDFTLWGVEDLSLYKQAVEDYRQVAQDRDRFDLYLKKIESTTETLKNRLLSPSLQTFSKERKAYREGNLALTSYFNALLREAQLENVSMAAYTHLNLLKTLKEREETIDFAKANEQHLQAVLSLSTQDQEALKELSNTQNKADKVLRGHKDVEAYFFALEEKMGAKKADYAELSKYFDYLKSSKDVEARQVLKEIDALENRILETLYRNDEEKTLIQCENILFYLQKLFHFTLTPDEFGLYKEQTSGFTIEHLTGFLNKQIMEMGTYYDRSLFLEEGYDAVLAHAENFYETTRVRDEHFLKEALAKMSAENTSKAVLITGGFHTSNLKALLKQKGISFVSVTPQVWQETNMKKYESILLGQQLKNVPAAPRASLAMILSVLTTAALEKPWGQSWVKGFAVSLDTDSATLATANKTVPKNVADQSGARMASDNEIRRALREGRTVRIGGRDFKGKDVGTLSNALGRAGQGGSVRINSKMDHVNDRNYMPNGARMAAVEENGDSEAALSWAAQILTGYGKVTVAVVGTQPLTLQFDKGLPSQKQAKAMEKALKPLKALLKPNTQYKLIRDVANDDSPQLTIRPLSGARLAGKTELLAKLEGGKRAAVEFLQEVGFAQDLINPAVVEAIYSRLVQNVETEFSLNGHVTTAADYVARQGQLVLQALPLLQQEIEGIKDSSILILLQAFLNPGDSTSQKWADKSLAAWQEILNPAEKIDKGNISLMLHFVNQMEEESKPSALETLLMRRIKELEPARAVAAGARLAEVTQIPNGIQEVLKQQGFSINNITLKRVEVDAHGNATLVSGQPVDGIDSIPVQAGIGVSVLQAIAGSAHAGILGQAMGRKAKSKGKDFGKIIDAAAVVVGKRAMEAVSKILGITIAVGGNEGSFRDASAGLKIGMLIKSFLHTLTKIVRYVYFGDSVEVTNGVKRESGRPGTSSMILLAPSPMMPSTDGYRISLAIDKFNPEREFPEIDPVITTANSLKHVLTQIAEYMGHSTPEEIDAFIRQMTKEYKFATLDRPKHDQLRAQADALGFEAVSREDGDPLLFIRAMLGVKDNSGKKLLTISTGGANEHIMGMAFAALYKKALMYSAYASTETLKAVDKAEKGTGRGSLEKARNFTDADMAEFKAVNLGVAGLEKSGEPILLGPATREEVIRQILNPRSKELAAMVNGPSALVVSSNTGANEMDWGVLSPFMKPVTWMVNEDGTADVDVSGFFIGNDSQTYFYEAQLSTPNAIDARYDLVAANIHMTEEEFQNPLFAKYDVVRKPLKAALAAGNVDPRLINAYYSVTTGLLAGEEGVGGLFRELDGVSRSGFGTVDRLRSVISKVDEYFLGLPFVILEDGRRHDIVQKAGARMAAGLSKAAGLDLLKDILQKMNANPIFKEGRFSEIKKELKSIHTLLGQDNFQQGTPRFNELLDSLTLIAKELRDQEENLKFPYGTLLSTAILALSGHAIVDLEPTFPVNEAHRGARLAATVGSNSIPDAKVRDWVNETAKYLGADPNQIEIIDSSDDARLIDEEIAAGNLVRLPDGNYYGRSHNLDVARVVSRTMVATSNVDDRGVYNNWQDATSIRSQIDTKMKGAVKPREKMYVIPHLMGPEGSDLSKAVVQITNSRYVAINMIRMARVGEPAWNTIANTGEFIKGVHYTGDLDKINRSGKEGEDDRYFVSFPETREIWSYGSAYGGNALLGKKFVSLRQAGWDAVNEGWLAEHMYLLEVERLDGPHKGKKQYIAGGYPSASGKTNAAMIRVTEALKGKVKVSVVGDDIAWMRPGEDGRLYAVNPEAGFFGVVPGTNENDNPAFMEAIGPNTGTIFTNVAYNTITQELWWEGKGPKPTDFTGWTNWKGEAITEANAGQPWAHPNSRATTAAKNAPNLSESFQDPKGVAINMINFGGRSPEGIPLAVVFEDPTHGMYDGASVSVWDSGIATQGDGNAGKMKPDWVAKDAFLAKPEDADLRHELKVVKGLTNPPVFAHVNWFRKDPETGKFMWPGFGLNMYVFLLLLDFDKNDTTRWNKTPIGYIPTPDAFYELGLTEQEVSRETLEKLLTVDREWWLKEIDRRATYFKEMEDKLGRPLPAEMWAINARIKAELEAMPATGARLGAAVQHLVRIDLDLERLVENGRQDAKAVWDNVRQTLSALSEEGSDPDLGDVIANLQDAVTELHRLNLTYLSARVRETIDELSPILTTGARLSEIPLSGDLAVKLDQIIARIEQKHEDLDEMLRDLIGFRNLGKLIPGSTDAMFINLLGTLVNELEKRQDVDGVASTKALIDAVRSLSAADREADRFRERVKSFFEAYPNGMVKLSGFEASKPYEQSVGNDGIFRANEEGVLERLRAIFFSEAEAMRLRTLERRGTEPGNLLYFASSETTSSARERELFILPRWKANTTLGGFLYEAQATSGTVELRTSNGTILTGNIEALDEQTVEVNGRRASIYTIETAKNLTTGQTFNNAKITGARLAEESHGLTQAKVIDMILELSVSLPPDSLSVNITGTNKDDQSIAFERSFELNKESLEKFFRQNFSEGAKFNVRRNVFQIYGFGSIDVTPVGVSFPSETALSQAENGARLATSEINGAAFVTALNSADQTSIKGIALHALKEIRAANPNDPNRPIAVKVGQFLPTAKDVLNSIAVLLGTYRNAVGEPLDMGNSVLTLVHGSSDGVRLAETAVPDDLIRRIHEPAVANGARLSVFLGKSVQAANLRKDEVKNITILEEHLRRFGVQWKDKARGEVLAVDLVSGEEKTIVLADILHENGTLQGKISIQDLVTLYRAAKSSIDADMGLNELLEELGATQAGLAIRPEAFGNIQKDDSRFRVYLYELLKDLNEPFMRNVSIAFQSPNGLLVQKAKNILDELVAENQAFRALRGRRVDEFSEGTAVAEVTAPKAAFIENGYSKIYMNPEVEGPILYSTKYFVAMARSQVKKDRVLDLRLKEAAEKLLGFTIENIGEFKNVTLGVDLQAVSKYALQPLVPVDYTTAVQFMKNMLQTLGRAA